MATSTETSYASTGLINGEEGLPTVTITYTPEPVDLLFADAITTPSTNGGGLMDGVVITPDGSVWSNGDRLDGLYVESPIDWRWDDGIGGPQDADTPNRPIIEESRLWADRDDLFGNQALRQLTHQDSLPDPMDTNRDWLITGDSVTRDGSDLIDPSQIDPVFTDPSYREMQTDGQGNWFVNPSEAETLRQLTHHNTDQFT